MRLFAALGPGDIVAAHRTQLGGGTTRSETSIVFSGQIIEYCRERGIELLALSHNARRDVIVDGGIQVENSPARADGAAGLRFFAAQIFEALRLAVRAWRFKADLAIVDSGTTQYFALALFRLLGVRVAVNFHNTLWPNGFRPQGRKARIKLALDRWFFRRVAAAAIGCSPECGRQVRELAGRELSFFEYRGQFRSEGFRPRPIAAERTPFRIVFVGRVEQNKGVFDVVSVADALRQRSYLPVVFEICGDGNALPDLKRAVAEKKLAAAVTIHGRLARPDLLNVYSRAHAIIVPTRSTFCEGLPLVCAEAVLAGIPIVTSRLSNALPVLGPAIAEAAPEDVDSYAAAIRKLVEDPAEYDRLRAACPELARQFVDRARSYPAAVDRLIAHLFPNWRTLDDFGAIFSRIG